MAAIKDPLVSAWFGVDFGGEVKGAFRECSGMGSETEVVEYKASGEKGEFVIQKVPGRMKWNNITLKRGITDSMDMWKWRRLVEQGNRAGSKERHDQYVQHGRYCDCPVGFYQCMAFQTHGSGSECRQQRGRYRRDGADRRRLRAKAIKKIARAGRPPSFGHGSEFEGLLCPKVR